MPSYETVWRWEQDDPEFCKASSRAREAGTHFLAGDCLRIADDLAIDPSHKRLMIDTRIRLIGKWNAKNYGERVELAGDKENPLLVMLEAGRTLDAKLERLIGRKSGASEK